MVCCASSGKALRAPKLCCSPKCVYDGGTALVMQLFFPGAGSVRGPSRWSPSSALRPVVCLPFCPLVFVGSPPGEGAVLVLSVLRFFVLHVVLAVEGRFLLSFGASVAVGLLSMVRPGLRRFPHGLCIWAVLRHFSSCGVPARWRDLRYVVRAFAASSFPPSG